MLRQIIPRTKHDGVIDAVHYDQDGKVAWVRAYERRGPTWSDHVLLDRETLIRRLESGKRFYGGQRRQFRASEFELSLPVRLRQTENGAVLVTGDRNADQDDLEGIPII